MVSIKSKNCLINIFQKMDRLIKQSDWLPVDGLPEQLTLWLAKSTSSKYSIRNSCKYREFGKTHRIFFKINHLKMFFHMYGGTEKGYVILRLLKPCAYKYHYDFIFHGRITKFSKSLFSFLINIWIMYLLMYHT